MTPPALVLVVAHDRNRAIGRGNALPWHLPDDLRRFKALTLGRPIVMGRRTAEAIGRPLPGRRNLVLTRRREAPVAGMEVVASLAEASRIAQADGAAELCVIGGGEIYALALPLADVLQVTHVDTVVDAADTFFPAIIADDWQPVWRQAHAADARHVHAYEYVEYRRAARQAIDAPNDVLSRA